MGNFDEKRFILEDGGAFLPHLHSNKRFMFLETSQIFLTGYEEPLSPTWDELIGNGAFRSISQFYPSEALNTRLNNWSTFDCRSNTSWRTYITYTTNHGYVVTARSLKVPKRLLKFWIGRRFSWFWSIFWGAESRVQSIYKRWTRWGLRRRP